jgi:integrase/recombinase XerD
VLVKVQKVVKPNNQTSWLVLDSKFKPVASVLEFTKFLEATDKSPNTVKAYVHHLKLYWEFLEIESLSWVEVGLEALTDFIRWLQTGDNSSVTTIGNVESKRTNKTINLIMAAVSSFYDYHSRTGKVSELNIYKDGTFSGKYKSFLHHISKGKTTNAKVLTLKEPKKRLKTLSMDDVKLVINSCNNIRDKFMLCLMYETGMRIGQVLGLRHKDILSGDNKILVRFRPDNENQARTKSPWYSPILTIVIKYENILKYQSHIFLIHAKH